MEQNQLKSKMSWSDFKLNSDGMVPVIVQDYKTDEVLMFAYMNEEAYLTTLKLGKMTYWSRSRNELWTKGLTSGHVQYVKSLTIDCDNDLEEIEYTAPLSTFNFNIGNYKTIPSRRFGRLDETKVSNKKISLLKYDKDKLDGISIEQDNERIKITNDNDQKVYVILDKFLDKRVYEVGYIKYINTTSLRGKYTVYFKVGNKLYKTNSYVEG